MQVITELHQILDIEHIGKEDLNTIKILTLLEERVRSVLLGVRRIWILRMVVAGQ